jgi:hypothetical protein
MLGNVDTECTQKQHVFSMKLADSATTHLLLVTDAALYMK